MVAPADAHGEPENERRRRRADPGIRTIIALLSGRKANEAIDEGERKDREANEAIDEEEREDRDANEAFDEDERGDREASKAIDEDEREDRGTSAISQPPQHPAPVKQKKTAEELEAMIQQDLSQLEGWPERGVKVTVYGFNPWNSMLTIGVEAGPVPRDDLQGLCYIITERLKRLYVIDAGS